MNNRQRLLVAGILGAVCCILTGVSAYFVVTGVAGSGASVNPVQAAASAKWQVVLADE